MEDDISSKVLKFTDDTKVFRKVTNVTDKQSLQDDLDKLVKWSEKWQMLLNFGKCKCIHIGHGNMDEEYKMGDAVLGRTTQEKDLGVTFSADMKVSEQCRIAASKGNQVLALIRRTITGGLHIDEKFFCLSINQWLPCPLAIWNLLFGMAVLLNLVKNSATPLIRPLYLSHMGGNCTEVVPYKI